MWNRNKQRISLRHEHPRASTLCRVDTGGSLIGVWIDLLDDVNFTGATDHINAMTFTVVEDLVGIAGDIDLCNNIARIGVEHDQLGGKAAADKQSMIRFIKRHGKIRESRVCFPLRNHLAFIAVDYRDVTRVGDIDENSVTAFLQLESLGMCAELYGTNLFPVGRVNHGNATAAESDIKFFSRFIVTNVVGVIS